MIFNFINSGCRNKDLQVSDWSGRCIGQLGAVQPSILPQRPALAHNSTPFAFNMKDMTFVKAALSELTRAFQYEKHTKVFIYMFACFLLNELDPIYYIF